MEHKAAHDPNWKEYSEWLRRLPPAPNPVAGVDRPASDDDTSVFFSKIWHPQHGESEKVPDWLAVPGFDALPAEDQRAIGQRALRSANAKHPAGMNLPALLSAIIAICITGTAMGLERPEARWRWLLFLPIAGLELVGSIFFGWWWWRLAHSRAFKKVIRREMDKRMGK